MNIVVRGLNRLRSELRAECIKLINGGSIELGRNVRVGKGSSLVTANGGKIYVGNNTFINRNCTIVSQDSIRIGNDCLLGVNICIFDHDHRFRDANKLISEQGFKTEQILIGNNCWIGSNVFISKGVTIGDNSVIAAGLRIDTPIPPNTLVKADVKLHFEPIVRAVEHD